MSPVTGKAAAAGRLNMTWYRSDEDLPDMNDYDIIQGKRTYQYFDREVLYPFGYGLTYAAFSYEKMQIKKERGCIKVSCFIKNTMHHHLSFVKVKSFAPRQIQRRLFAALVTLSRKVF